MRYRIRVIRLRNGETTYRVQRKSCWFMSWESTNPVMPIHSVAEARAYIKFLHDQEVFDITYVVHEDEYE